METLEQWTHDEEGVLMHCGEYGQWYDCPDHDGCYGVECAVCGAEIPTDCMEGEDR